MVELPAEPLGVDLLAPRPTTTVATPLPTRLVSTMKPPPVTPAA